jgi:hypothetical protein
MCVRWYQYTGLFGSKHAGLEYISAIQRVVERFIRNAGGNYHHRIGNVLNLQKTVKTENERATAGR